MPLILSGNVASATADAGYTVANSCRFNSGDSAYMYKTNGTATDVQKFTVSLWIKKSLGGGHESIFAIGDDATDFINVRSRSGGEIQFMATLGDVGITDYKTNALHRDPSAWYHYVVAIDTTESSGDRIRIYVNGTEETSFAGSTEMDQNANLTFLTDEIVTVGRISYTDASHFNGYISEVVFIDGLQLTPSSFGEFDEDSPTIWKPKNVSGLTFGTNGFYLDFEDSANLGNDANGGTDFTETNIDATNQATDTCTNNYPTFNPLIKPTTDNLTIENGNLSRTNGASDAWTQIYTTIGASSGKYYFEAKIDSTSNSDGFLFGIADVDSFDNSSGVNIGTVTRNYLYQSNGNKRTSGTDTAFGDSLTTGDIVGVAFDLDNNYIYFSKNGTWQDSGDPTSGASGTGSAFNITSGYTYCPAFATYYTPDDFSANFGGCPAFAISSGNADANGYGNFEYAPPSGYFALCTKNLAEYG